MKRRLSIRTQKLMAVSLILALLITFACPWLAEGRTGSATTYISLAFDGIGEGLDSKGNHFDINEIKNEEILKKVLKNTGLEKKYTPQELKQRIVITPLAGKSALNELTKMNIRVDKTESVAEKAIHTGDYEITVKEIGLLPNPFANLKLSKALVTEYQNHLKTAYLKDSSVSLAYKKDDMFSLDYPEMMLVMAQEADALVRYIATFEKNSPEFVSQKTGLTFADLRSQAETVRDKEVGNTADIVDYYILSKDDNRSAYENVKLKRANLILTKDQGIEGGINYILQAYDNTSNYIIASEDAADLATSQENEFYGMLMDQLVNSKHATISAKYDVTKIQQHLDKLSHPQNPETVEAMTKSVSKDAKVSFERMEELKSQVKALAEENYDLNIGSKISISKASYHVHTWGNLLVNFILFLILVKLIHSLYLYYKGKEKDYFREALANKYQIINDVVQKKLKR
ncbi:hypothetical protein Ami103574_07135 [Aminipila butyrica]|uniref:Uncharacterized protein n=1 Tax=Aminipila butyrica TaxID=433296 RepID=A0A858BVH3_9FIRM|nr:hypothetical protein [Aminipila butyrica]QIB69108.1 hypothetical protein Ami103574_07135 [Aminipila butyrica]